MDILTNKSIMISISLMITIMIITGVIIIYNEAKEIYGEVYIADTSISEQFEDILTTYNGSTLNGVGLINTIKRFENNSNVVIEYLGCDDVRTAATSSSQREAVYLNNLMKNEQNSYSYFKEYTVSAEYISNNSKIKIKFN